MDFRRQTKTARFHDPRQEMALVEVEHETRFDPLTGESGRICHFAMDRLPPVDVAPLAAATRANCPFCPDAVHTVTPRFADDLVPGGRLQRGGAVLVPNLFPYDDYSAIAVMTPQHVLETHDMPAAPIVDSLGLAREFLQRLEQRPQAQTAGETWYPLISWNHMPPSGGSQMHPHMQVILTSTPTNVQRRRHDAERAWLAQHDNPFALDLLAAERGGERWIGESGGISWLAPFRPTGMLGDCQAVFSERSSFTEIDDDDIAEFASGLQRMLKGFAGRGLWSFSLVFFSGTSSNSDGAASQRLTAQLVPRFYVNPQTHAPDTAFLQLMMGEWICMTYPEETAALLRTAWTGKER